MDAKLTTSQDLFSISFCPVLFQQYLLFFCRDVFRHKNLF